MTPLPRFALKGINLVHETIDGETVILNLEAGIYYSLAGSGAEIWSALLHGAAIPEITADLATRYDAGQADLAQAVAGLVDQLCREGILVPCTEATTETSSLLPPANGTGELPRRAFSSPTLSKYDDMQDLLLIDPIHEVEEQQGWPVRKSEAKP